MNRCTLLAFLLLTAAGSASADALETMIDDARGGTFRAVTENEHIAATRLFRKLLIDPSDRDIAPALRALDLEQTTVDVSRGVIMVIRERDDARWGRGIFAFQRDPAGSVVLQIPHSRSDRHTGRLGAHWFETQPFRAVAWNTIRRDETDLAAADPSYFTALAEAARSSLTRPAIVQIHGFDPDRRRTTAGRNATIIMSSGANRPNAETLTRTRCLMALASPVSLYPVDVRELGGTRNAIAQRFNADATPGFVHVEFVDRYRQLMLDDDLLMQESGKCLAAP